MNPEIYYVYARLLITVLVIKKNPFSVVICGFKKTRFFEFTLQFADTRS